MPRFELRVKTAAAEDRLLAIMREVPTELFSTVDQMATDFVFIFASVAPHGESGRLGRGIRATPYQTRNVRGQFSSGRNYAITASAKDFRGFDYVGVTRFGHRHEFIRPDEGRFIASVISTHKLRAPHSGRHPALRIPARRAGKDAIYRGVVKGVRHSHDWAQDGVFLASAEADRKARDLAHTIEVRFGG